MLWISYACLLILFFCFSVFQSLISYILQWFHAGLKLQSIYSHQTEMTWIKYLERKNNSKKKVGNTKKRSQSSSISWNRSCCFFVVRYRNFLSSPLAQLSRSSTSSVLLITCRSFALSFIHSFIYTSSITATSTNNKSLLSKTRPHRSKRLDSHSLI